MPASVRDALGVEILPGDTVRVTAWGAPVRLIDTGRTGVVADITSRGNVRLEPETNPYADPIARGQAIRPGHLSVVRRDGSKGFEGNLPEHRAAYLASLGPA